MVLVGAGPGDPGLLTLKALRALNEADVIMYDRLVSDDIMALARRDATRVSVGKQPGEDHHATQARIHALLVEHRAPDAAWCGSRAATPSSSDAAARNSNTCASTACAMKWCPASRPLACAAYAGIPLTHREHAQSVRLVTAHCRDDEDNLDWPALAREKQTLAFYMGVGQLDALSRRLISHGRAPDTPFALIENGSRPEQRVLSGAVKDLPDLARAHGIRSPALLIVGEVAGLASRLQWFGRHIDGGQGDGQPQRLAA